jgi:hypothetical protein
MGHYQPRPTNLMKPSGQLIKWYVHKKNARVQVMLKFKLTLLTSLSSSHHHVPPHCSPTNSPRMPPHLPSVLKRLLSVLGKGVD